LPSDTVFDLDALIYTLFNAVPVAASVPVGFAVAIIIYIKI
jgi:hypothetical protein